MISRQFITTLATRLQTTEENIAREYCQHLFLSFFYKRRGSEKLLFKGGTALRIIFNSPRFSEDLDFSALNSGNITIPEINQIIDDTLLAIMELGIEPEKRLNSGTNGATSGGYYAVIYMTMLEFNSELKTQISFRPLDQVGRSSNMISNEFIDPYLIHYLVSV